MPDLMQNDFVLPGAPGCVAGAAATVPRLREVLDWFRTKRWPVFHMGACQLRRSEALPAASAGD
jgi:nicotinamidase-related amidase